MKWSSASERAPLSPSRSLSLKVRGSYRPSSSQIRVPVMAHSSSSWCQSAELRASREHSRPSTIPARPRETSATRCWNPSRSAALAPEWPWSMSMTVIWSAAQPSAVALPRRSYWRMADSVLRMTCLSVDWRTYKRACRDRWAAVTLDVAVSGNTRCSFVVGGWRSRGGSGQDQAGQGADELGCQRGGRRGPVAGQGPVRRRRAAGGGRQAGDGVAPCGDALAGQHAQAERERLGARVQGSMAQLLVPGI